MYFCIWSLDSALNLPKLLLWSEENVNRFLGLLNVTSCVVPRPPGLSPVEGAGVTVSHFILPLGVAPQKKSEISKSWTLGAVRRTRDIVCICILIMNICSSEQCPLHIKKRMEATFSSEATWEQQLQVVLATNSRPPVSFHLYKLF